ncbi:TPA: outer membrane usher protein LpfC [Escherichia albertii]|uniref:Outer membrane usher protein LpfC n=1 Tax=Escherichia albertii TaxID=208962 RepID=A0ABD7E8Y7_ESCAL|nr:outer membrane usher protein LpfC [Escherichia albertii]QST73746.1 outer membrane usher protein LpfC [Escherichia albertii]HEB1299566.1 outer membrane usher protein LpfC [Escherichia albertii]
MSRKAVSRSFSSVPFSFSMLTLMVASSFPATAGKFNPRFLEDVEGVSQHIDLAMYESGREEQLPGTYRVSLIVNDQKMETRTLEFKAATESQRKVMGEALVPCLSRTQLADMGVRVESFPALNLVPAEACVAFDDIIPQSSSHFDFSEQKLVMSFPQAAMHQVARGTVPESEWDEGIPALLLDYSFSGSNSKYDSASTDTRYVDQNGIEQHDSSDKQQKSDSYYLNLRSGLNIGPWRLRNYGTWSHSDGQAQWTNIGTHLTRAIIPLKAQITLGDTATPSDIFDSVQMRGALLSSDDDMLPDSQRGFAPVVRGIAKSNAEVSIEQNGYVIYRTFVQPGAFEINDLYPTANSGDLTVIIKEADGSEQKFVQPFSAVVIFQREGHLKYSLAAGEYRAGNYNSGNPKFGQADAIYGLPLGMTAYGGTLLSENYSTFALGLGKNFGSIGAVSVDITQAKSDLAHGDSSQGQSYRFLYSKSFESGMDFRLVGYKYSTSGFYTFQEATDVRSGADSDYSRYHKRSEIQGNLTQQLGAYGSVYFNMTQQDYWNNDGKQLSLSTGYNGRIGRVNYSLAYSWNKNPGWDGSDRLWSLNFSIPLGRAWSNYRLTTDQDGRTTQQLGVSGTLLEERNLNYNVQEGYSSNGTGNSGNASMGYQGGSGDIDVGYSYGKDYQQLSYNLRGGIIVHSEGITLSQPLGETMTLISVPGASNAHVENNGGVQVDWFGNAVVPYAMPYRENEVSLRSDTLGDDVDVVDAFQRVVPTRGAVVRARFDTRVGYRVLMTLQRSGAQPVPFGATATLISDNKTDVSSIVGEEGQLYISGMPEEGRVQVKWGKEESQQCIAQYVLSVEMKQAGIIPVSAKCQ